MRSAILSTTQYGLHATRHLFRQQQLAHALLVTFNGCTNRRSFCSSQFMYGSKSTNRLLVQPMQFSTQPFGIVTQLQQRGITIKNTDNRACKSDVKTSSVISDDADLLSEGSKLGLFAKFKLMYKKYWYVLIPVHIVTSIGWYGGFYYLIKSGVDMVSLLEYMHVSENIIHKVQGSSMGHLALAYLCFKVATPFRYAVTLGGTTVSIKYLVQAGHIKPLPSKKEFIQMYEDKKASRAAIKAEKIMEKDKKKEMQ